MAATSENLRDSAPSFKLGLLEPRVQRPVQGTQYHEWLLPGNIPWTRFYRVREGYRLRFPDLADFDFSVQRPGVKCYPVPGVDEATCQHLYWNQVLPLIVSAGEVVLHGSAVDAATGAVAFIGKSGSGKSTLAASFATGGHRFLTDDALVLKQEAGVVQGLPGHPSIRLWKDSEQALLGDCAPGAGALPYSDKRRFPAGEALLQCAEKRPLRALFFLGRDASTVEFQPMGRSAATMALVTNSFMLDPGDPEALASHFERVTSVANSLDCYELHYPRRYESLEGVRRSILREVLAA